jgi:hypothetical protein
MNKLDNLFDKLNEAFKKVTFNNEIKTLCYELLGKAFEKGVVFEDIHSFSDDAIIFSALKINGEKRKLFIDNEEFVKVVWIAKNGDKKKEKRLFFDEEEIPNLITILL